MSLAIDAVILFAAVILIWLGAKRGFIRSAMGLVSGIASAIAAYAYTPVLAAYIRKNYLIDHLTSGIAETLRSLALDTETDLYDLNRLAEDLPEPFTSILERYNIDIEAFSTQIRGLTGCEGEVVDAFAEQIAAPTADLIASVLAFAVLFLVVLVVLSLLTALLDLIFTLPVLRSANMLLGVVFGVVEAAFFASLLATVLSVLTSALGAIDPGRFGPDLVENTIICQFILRHNLVDRLMAALGWC
ncbi:MAG: CvpA family protein [Eubacteriales bacterium]